jgi:hypothetical protein
MKEKEFLHLFSQIQQVYLQMWDYQRCTICAVTTPLINLEIHVEISRVFYITVVLMNA